MAVASPIFRDLCLPRITTSARRALTTNAQAGRHNRHTCDFAHVSQFPVTYIPNPKPKKHGFPQPSSSQHCCLASSLLHIPAWSSCASPGFLSPTGPCWSRPPLVFGGQFLCGVVRSAPAGKHDSQVRLPARVLPVWALLGSSVGRHSLSPTGLRESQQPTS